jgi:hypothetical protein
MTAQDRIRRLGTLVAKCEKSLADFTAINEELSTLSRSARLEEVIEVNKQTIETTRRMLESARDRLEAEQRLIQSGLGTLRAVPSEAG